MRNLVTLLLVLAITWTAFSQDIEPAAPPTGMEPIALTFPVPVMFLSGEVPLVGTVNVPDLNNYFVEIRAFVPPAAGATPAPELPWSPATLPARTPVINSVIALWDTTLVPDGLYEIRLAVTTSSGRQYYRVAPLRVVNEPLSVSPYLALYLSRLAEGSAALAASPTPPPFPTMAASSPAPFATPTLSGPAVQSQVNANVRQGDSTLYPIVGSLPLGTVAPIIGISTTGSGWYYIQLANGVRGFISPSTVVVIGNTVAVPPVMPPPAPTLTPTLTPSATLPAPASPTPSATLTPSPSLTPTATPTLFLVPVTLIPLFPTSTPFFFPVTLVPIFPTP